MAAFAIRDRQRDKVPTRPRATRLQPERERARTSRRSPAGGELGRLRAENKKLKDEVKRLKKKVKQLEADLVRAIRTRMFPEAVPMTDYGEAMPGGHGPPITPGHEPPSPEIS